MKILLYFQHSARFCLSAAILSVLCLVSPNPLHAASPAQIPPVGQTLGGYSGDSSTALTFDVSGSMSRTDASGEVKIEAAKRAAKVLINLIDTENSIQPGTNLVGVVAFNDKATELLNLTSDLTAVRNTVDRLSAADGTNMVQGLTLALDQLSRSSATNRNANGGELSGRPRSRFIILLSDGVPTVSFNGTQANNESDLPALQKEVLDGPVKRARSEGVCVHVIGLGDPNRGPIEGIDEPFLQKVAQESGCGQYALARDASQLGVAYVKLRHSALGRVIGEFNGRISQGQTVNIGGVDVVGGQAELHITLQWPGSNLELNLLDPRGRPINANYPGATLRTFSNLVYVIIKNPTVGRWVASTFGKEVPEGSLRYDALFSLRNNPVTTAIGSTTDPIMIYGGIGLMGLLFIIVGIVLLSKPRQIQRGRSQRPKHKHTYSSSTFSSRRRPTVVAVPPNLGEPFPLKMLDGETNIIGRDAYRCQVVVSDSQASRRHVEVLREHDGFVVRDLGSQNGTRLNGKRLVANMPTRVRSGAVLHIGKTALRLSE